MINNIISSDIFKKSLFILLFIAILLMAAYFRFTGINWDRGNHLHPDELFLTMVTSSLQWPSSFSDYLDSSKSTLNPRNVGFEYFTYGTLPTTIVKGLSILVNQREYEKVYLVGRTLSGIFDIGTIILLFFMALIIYKDKRIAFLASFFLASTVLMIQHSHFFVVDSFCTFFSTLTLYWLVRFQFYGKFINVLMTGICLALALACKLSVFTLIIVVLFTFAYRIAKGNLKTSLLKNIGLFIFVGVICFIMFRIAMPDAFSGTSLFKPDEKWMEGIKKIHSEMQGGIDQPFCRQWTGRTPLIYPAKNIIFWGMGIPLGIIAFAGWFIAGFELFYREKTIHLIPFTWAGILFLHQGIQFVKYMRYFLPIYPVLILLGAWLLIKLLDLSKEKTVKIWKLKILSPVIAKIVIAFVIISTFIWAFGFTEIYRRAHPRIVASRWIYENIPEGTVIAHEHWDDVLPLNIDGKNNSIYPPLEMQWYEDDNQEKFQKAIEWINRAQYIILASNRLYDSIPRLPVRYPMTIKYYNSLFDGTLGFEKVGEFTSYPSIMGISIPDYWAEESFTVYDHPKVLIFKKTPSYSSERAKQILGNVNWDDIICLRPKEAAKSPNGFFFTPEDQLLYKNEGTWAELFNRESFINKMPVIIWMVLLELFSIIAFPYLFLACKGLPDRGYSFSRILGLLLLGWGIWILASLRLISFSRSSILGVLFLLSVIAFFIYYKKRKEFKDFLINNKDTIIFELTLFWLFFSIFLFIRWFNPDLWHPVRGGEKPMDFAYLNAIIKSPYFPPYNPWFSHAYINYYYFGFVLIGSMIKLTGIVPCVAYNLSIPTLFAMTAIGAFGVVLGIIRKDNKVEIKQLFMSLTGPLFVAIIGNLGELRLLVNSFASLSNMDLSHRGLYIIKVIHGITLFLSGKILPVNVEWWYWNPTRLIAHPDSEAGPINEFPWFTYLYGDLHAHAIALPLTLLALGIMVAILHSSKLNILQIGIISLVIGALWSTNTWDLPAYSLILFITILFFYKNRGVSYLQAIKKSIWLSIIIIFSGYILYLPYHQWYASAYNTAELWKGSHTSLRDYMTIHGFFIFLILTAMIIDFWFEKNQNRLTRTIKIFIKYINKIGHLLKIYRRLGKVDEIIFWSAIINLLLVFIISIIIFYLNPLTGFCILLIFIAFLLIFKPAPDPGRQISLTFVIIGLFLSIMVEFIVLKGDISRMNTVFKFYFQIWVFFGIASAASFVLILKHFKDLEKPLKFLWTAGFISLFIIALLYPVLATRAKICDRFVNSTGRTLNGMAFMDKSFYNADGREICLLWDKKAIEWLQDNVKGTPVICEMNNGFLYNWSNRFSIYTGLPSIIGWDWHQRQQRPFGGELVTKRLERIRRIYDSNSPEEAYKILKNYNVEYIIVGQFERANSILPGIDKFGANKGILWELVYDNPDVQIYKLK